MIYGQTLRSLSEDEISILFLICDNLLSPCNVDVSFNYLKMLRLDVTCKIIDVLETQALEEKKEIFRSLKNKLTQQ